MSQDILDEITKLLEELRYFEEGFCCGHCGYEIKVLLDSWQVRLGLKSE